MRLSIPAFALLTAVGWLGSAQAAVRQVAEGAIKTVCADADGAKHPKRFVLQHLVTPAPDASSALVLVRYEADGGAARRVVSKVTVTKNDGGKTVIGKFSLPVNQPTGSGASIDSVAADLAEAESARWKISFKKTPRLHRRECVTLLGAIGPDLEPQQ